MIKTTILNGRFLEEKELDFKTGINRIEEFFILGNLITSVNIRTEFSLQNGIAATFNNKIKIQDLSKCFKRLDSSTILIEFEEFKNTFALNSDSNIKLDLMHNRIYLLDFNITIYFT